MYTIAFTHWLQSPLHKKKDINVYSCIFNGPVNAVDCNTQIYTRNVFFYYYSVIHTASESHSQSYTLCNEHAVSNAYTIFFYPISVFFYIFMNFFENSFLFFFLSMMNYICKRRLLQILSSRVCNWFELC